MLTVRSESRMRSGWKALLRCGALYCQASAAAARRARVFAIAARRQRSLALVKNTRALGNRSHRVQTVVENYVIRRRRHRRW